MRSGSDHERLTLNAKVRKLLRELQLSLAKALGASPEIGEILEKIRQEGWTLYLVADRGVEEEMDDAFELTTPRALPAAEPVFRIDGQDLLFLKSVGIDPTRKGKRRKS